jgi:hydrogenase maturation protease
MKILILGLGNTLISDDGVGIIVKRYLERKFQDVENVDFCESSWGGFRIIDLFQDYDYAIVVDAIKTETKPEGHIHRLKPADLLHTLRLTSYHDINFITALKLGESMSFKMPQDIDIFAIEIENNYTIAETLSSKIIQAVGKCSTEIYELLTSKKIIEDKIDKNLLNKIIPEADLKELYKEEFSEIEQY